MKTILIVDVDEVALVGLERALEDDGFRTTTAWGREEAFPLSARARFDVLLIDEGLFAANYQEFTQEFRRSQPKAVVCLMHTRKSLAEERSDVPELSICKWKFEQVKARVRGRLAA